MLIDFRSKHPTKEIVIEGTQWEYISCGLGHETLLVLNGGLRIAETAFAYIELFEPYYRVIVPTYPPIMSIDDLTNGILAIVDQEQVSEFLLLGQSYGGMVAQVIVQRFPDRVKKMVLSSTGPLSAPKFQRLALKIILKVAPFLPEGLLKNLYKKSIFQILSIPVDHIEFWKEYLNAIFESRLTKDDVLSHFQTGADTLDKYAYGINEPWHGEILVIGGKKDPVSSDEDRCKITAYYPNVNLKIIKNAGHTAAIEKPDDYLDHVKIFFDD